jgi:tRNA 2-thiocytidine biosynthesis protein TtcA
MMDRELFPFQTIKATGAPMADGDIAFDEDEACGSGAPAAPSVIKLHRNDD